MLNMIYEGESNHTNDWTINDINKYFTTSINITLPANTELFFVRHGHGIHNDINIVDRIKTDLTDALLTPAGVSQAERAGGFLASYINMNYNNPNLFFEASTLRRTMQTIAIIMNKLYIEKPIHIVPCDNELPYHANGNCDTSYLNILGNAIFKENQPVCNSNINECNIINIDSIKNNTFNIKWEYYMKFKENNICKNTNIINQILECYKFYNYSWN
jgi:bisphosphoglycerate-dependent phosphoglycerate mutase